MISLFVVGRLYKNNKSYQNDTCTDVPERKKHTILVMARKMVCDLQCSIIANFVTREDGIGFYHSLFLWFVDFHSDYPDCHIGDTFKSKTAPLLSSYTICCHLNATLSMTADKATELK